MLIDLDRIDKGQRRDEAALWRAFETERPRLVHGLLSALSTAMRIEPGLKVPGLFRMADFTRWGAAAVQALGFSGGTASAAG